jgi:hypothetical protein
MRYRAAFMALGICYGLFRRASNALFGRALRFMIQQRDPRRRFGQHRGERNLPWRKSAVAT